MFEKKTWSNSNRFSQTGYSAPTEWPEAHNYTDLDKFQEDVIKAIEREQSHREWMEDERRDRAYERERDSEED